MSNLTTVLVAALEKAQQALYNVPEVGKKYDQQHSHTQTAATLVIEDALKLAAASVPGSPGADAAEAHRILSELCYNHDADASLTELATRVRNIAAAATGVADS